MSDPSPADALDRAVRHARRFLSSLPHRPVRAAAGAAAVRAALDRPLPERGLDPGDVVDTLARGAEPGIVASAGPRYFGFVNGGTLPAAMAADWLASAWDQNAAAAVMSPAASAVEDIAARWVLELLGLPPHATVGFVTGCQMANFVGLAAARHAVLARAGWDVEERGLAGAPPVDVFVGEEAHVTVVTALRLLGFGAGRVRRVRSDDQGRMRADALASDLGAASGPAIVCAQAGNVNTGAVDPMDGIVSACRARGAWLHVDGAFGLWARASPARRHLVRGVEGADSWATDAHKWLNVPYDSGIAIVRDGAAHRAAMGKRAAYLVPAGEGERDGYDFTPEASRRARGFALYAALLSLGRSGVAEIVESRCELATRLADRLRRVPGVRVLNDVVLNQVLVRFEPRDADAATLAVIERVQADGTCWVGPTAWRGARAMRVSICAWSTTRADVDRAADAILAAADAGPVARPAAEILVVESRPAGGLTLRDATPEDAGTVHELILALAVHAGGGDAVRSTPATLRAHLAAPRPPFEAVLAEEDGRVVGFALYTSTFGTWSGKPGLWLEDLLVREDARGRGIGERLLREVGRRAVERGCGRIDFAVLDRDDGATSFYRRLGGRRVDGSSTFRFDDASLAALGAA